MPRYEALARWGRRAAVFAFIAVYSGGLQELQALMCRIDHLLSLVVDTAFMVIGLEALARWSGTTAAISFLVLCRISAAACQTWEWTETCIVGLLQPLLITCIVVLLHLLLIKMSYMLLFDPGPTIVFDLVATNAGSLRDLAIELVGLIRNLASLFTKKHGDGTESHALWRCRRRGYVLQEGSPDILFLCPQELLVLRQHFRQVAATVLQLQRSKAALRSSEAALRCELADAQQSLLNAEARLEHVHFLQQNNADFRSCVICMEQPRQFAPACGHMCL